MTLLFLCACVREPAGSIPPTSGANGESPSNSVATRHIVTVPVSPTEVPPSPAPTEEAVEEPEETPVQVGRYQTLELVFTASQSPANPFDTYLLRLEVTDPAGRVFTLDGFYDGDGKGGQSGNVWKARLSPYVTGTWSWRTVAGDDGQLDGNLEDLSGRFLVVESEELGGVIADGRYFRFENGDYVYLVGNFLDFADSLRTTHVFMSEVVSEEERQAVIDRQCHFHLANKANIYFANLGDYNKESVTPWVGSANRNDKSQMDMARWQAYDAHILRFKENQMLAQLWFFADDSRFGRLSQEEQNRLFRYAMARTSAFNHTLYVIALEWQEGFTAAGITASGDFIQAHNPWQRLLSVHTIRSVPWDFAGQEWATFMASQAGNNSTPDQVNAYSIQMRNSDTIPHLGEEFGFLRGDSDRRLRGNLWANFTAGAAGSGTGSDLRAFQRFLAESHVPFQRMEPANELVEDGGSTRFVLAERDHHYVVYSRGGTFTLMVSGENLQGYWFNPRDPEATLSAPFAVVAGSQLLTPPESLEEDWVLWISDGAHLNSGVTHPPATLLEGSATGMSSDLQTPPTEAGDDVARDCRGSVEE